MTATEVLKSKELSRLYQENLNTFLEFQTKLLKPLVEHAKLTCPDITMNIYDSDKKKPKPKPKPKPKGGY